MLESPAALRTPLDSRNGAGNRMPGSFIPECRHRPARSLPAAHILSGALASEPLPRLAQSIPRTNIAAIVAVRRAANYHEL